MTDQRNNNAVEEFLKLIQKDSHRMDRRQFMRASGSFAMFSLGLTLLGTLPGCKDIVDTIGEESPEAPELAPGGEQGRSAFGGYPFTLGVASGDPLPDGVVLWTRLAPNPLAGGGMPNEEVPVKWEIAADREFRRIVKEGVEIAVRDLAHSVHAEVDGLEPGTVYYYRFIAGGATSPVGRTKTLPAYGSSVSRLTFAFASCQNWQQGLYTAYQHMAEEDLDLVFHLGDYIYEGGVNHQVRSHNGGEIMTLSAYRNRYALYRSDEHLQAAHAAFPWVVTMDDHELKNNYANDRLPGVNQPLDVFLRRRAAAYQAYYEHMPLRRSSLPDGPDMQLYRRLAYGNLAEFHVLDTRQYRDLQANGDGRKPPTPESTDPNRTLMGAEQEAWLTEGIGQADARWNVLAQQVFFSHRDYVVGAEEEFSMDAWDGYPANRERILNAVKEKGVSNLVVLTGDVHANWASEIKSDFKDKDSTNLGVEFVGTSISSGGDGSDTSTANNILTQNPHIKFYNNQRGYVRCTVTPDAWTTDYRIIPYVSRPGAPISTRATFVVENGKHTLRRV